MEFLIPFDITRLENQCRADRVRGSQKLGNKRVSSNFMRYRSGRELRLRAVGTPPEYVRERESHCVALSFGFLGEYTEIRSRRVGRDERSAYLL